MRILVIEDDPDVRRMLVAVLQEGGHCVDAAADGLEALELARAGAAGLVLCDMTLPGSLDGFAVARLLRADVLPPAVPIWALTARGRSQDRLQAEGAGISDYIVKPYDVDDLLRRISDVAS